MFINAANVSASGKIRQNVHRIGLGLACFLGLGLGFTLKITAEPGGLND